MAFRFLISHVCVFRARLMSTLLFLLVLSSPSAVWAEQATAVFAGGCFWCMEKPFDQLDGVIKTTSGYTGGHVKNPTYKAVSKGTTGHIEAVQITYDPQKIDYLTLLRTFWVNVDPLDGGGQFCDRGHHYTSAIFFGSEEEKKLALKTRVELEESVFNGKKITTQLIKADEFYPAEKYHQNYYKKNPVRYRYYRYGCGRDNRLDALWEDKKLPF